MPLQLITRSCRRIAATVAATSIALLALAAAAGAYPIDVENWKYPTPVRPTIVKETVLTGGPSTVAYVLTGIGIAVALLAAGYLGARFATRSIRPRHS